MKYKARKHVRNSDKDKLGTCKDCQQTKPLRWISHAGRKNGGYHASVCRECRANTERQRRNGQRITNDSIARQCSKCGENNPHRWISDVRNSAGGYYQNICLHCHSDSIKQQWRLLKTESVKYLGGVCMDCGLKDECVSVYDFHHRDPGAKEFNLGSLLKGKSIRQFDEIKPELDKCDLLCACCHRRRHSRYECCRRKFAQ